MISDRTIVRTIVVATAAVAALVAIGLAFRQEPAERPYLVVKGGGFIFNYRTAEIFYGLTAEIARPLPVGTVIEAVFEDPAGGAPHRQAQQVGLGSYRLHFESPPVRGIEPGRAYTITLSLVDRETGTPFWSVARAFSTDLDEQVLPRAPLTVGPGYHPNPEARPLERSDGPLPE